MARSVITLLDTYQLSSAQRLTAYPKVLQEAKARGLSALAAALEDWIAFDNALYREEGRWQRRKRRHVHGAEARSLDTKLDALLGSLEASLRAQTRLAGFKPERAAAAEDLLEELFPGGLAALTQAKFMDQALKTSHLIAMVRDSAEAIALLDKLDLMEVIDEIERLNEEYREAVGAGSRMNREKIEAKRREGLEGLGEIIARIIGAFPTESAEDRAARVALLGPIDWQNYLQSEEYREQRRGKSVGEEDPAFIGPKLEAA